jgi:hypothetical protein
MKKFVNFMILPEYRLILECCKGKALVEDAISMKKDEIADNLYNPDYNIIIDFREFEGPLEGAFAKSISIFADFLKELDIKSKAAFMTTKPHQVVVSEMLRRLSKDSLSMDIEIFSSPEAAIKFLGYPLTSFDLIKYKIEALNMNTV